MYKNEKLNIIKNRYISNYEIHISEFIKFFKNEFRKEKLKRIIKAV